MGIVFKSFFFIIIEHVPIGIGVEKQKKKTSENSQRKLSLSWQAKHDS